MLIHGDTGAREIRGQRAPFEVGGGDGAGCTRRAKFCPKMLISPPGEICRTAGELSPADTMPAAPIAGVMLLRP